MHTISDHTQKSVKMYVKHIMHKKVLRCMCSGTCDSTLNCMNGLLTFLDYGPKSLFNVFMVEVGFNFLFIIPFTVTMPFKLRVKCVNPGLNNPGVNPALNNEILEIEHWLMNIGFSLF